MSDLIDRQQAIKDAESWVAVDEYEKHLQKKVVEWLKELPSAEPNVHELRKDAVIDYLAKTMHHDDYGYELSKDEAREMWTERINKIPSVEYLGKWIHDGSHWANRWICDKCGYKLFGVKTKFCPDCGQRMEADNESND